jgi:hypothetical protein
MDDCLGDLVKIAGQAEHCDISGLTNINLATATTIYDEGPPDAETTISESVHPPVTLDVATGLEEAETDIEPDEPAPKKRRRGARLLLAEIAIVIGVAVGIGLRTYFTDETPVRKPVDGAWRALLDTIDIEQDTISENWKSLPRDGIVAFANETQNSRIAVGETLAPNYQVRMVFTRYEGPCGVGLVLPLGSGKQVSLEMDASNGSKTVLGDENYGVLTEYDGPLLTTGVRQMCLVTVENKLDWTRIRITLDGRKLIDYNGPTADLHCDPKWASKPGRLGVGVHKLVSAQIHELSVRSFTGDLAESRPATLP